MKYTVLELSKFGENARAHIELLEKSPSITAMQVAKINADTGMLLEDKLNNLMIGTIPSTNKTYDLITLLRGFSSTTVDKTTISIDRAAVLIGEFGKLLGSPEVTEMPELNEREIEWLDNNNFLPFTENERVCNGLKRSLKEMLGSKAEVLSGFLSDSKLVTTLHTLVKEEPNYLATRPIGTLITSKGITKDVSDEFNEVVFSATDKEHILVNAHLLSVMNLSVSKTTPFVLEFKRAMIEKIKEVSAEQS